MSRAVTLANIASGEAFSVDETNNRVGIASTIPDATLDIKNTILMDGDAGVITATSFSGSGASLTSLPAATGLTGTPDITVNNIIAVGATFSGVLTYEDVTNVDSIGVITARSGIRLGATGANTLVQGTATGVGIGQASPEALLHIEASSSGASYTADAADTLILERNGGCVIDFRTPAANDGGLIFSDNSARAQGTLLYNHSDNHLQFGTAGSERLRITSGGIIQLPVGANQRIGIADRHNSTGVGHSLTISPGGGYGSGKTSGDLLLSRGRGLGGAAGGAIKFGYNAGDNTAGLDIVQMILDVSGNLGIATDALARPLVIAKDSAASVIELKRTNTNTTGSVGALSWTAMDGHCVATMMAIGDGDNEGGDLVFKTTTAAASNNPYDASLLERVKITSIGDVEFSGTATGVSSCTWDASANSLIFKDNSYIKMGDGSDLSLYHDGSNSYVKDTGTGQLILDGEGVLLQYGSVTQLTTSASGVSIAKTCSDSVGDVRSVPLQDESGGAYVLAVSDKGQCVHAHGSTTAVTVNINTFAAGDVVSIVNGDTGTVAITQGTSFSLRNTADSSSGSKTLASFGMATIWFSGHNVGYISGSGLS